MKGLILRWLFNSLVLFALPYVIPGVSVSGFAPALAMALVLGMINAFLRPLLLIFSLPINLLTFGLFTLVVNGFLFWAAARVVSGYSVDGFGAALAAAFVFMLATMFPGFMLK
jgi:putative membrane protein